MPTQQALDALAKGNRIRLARAKLKRQVVAGTTDVADLIANPPECMAGAEILDVLQWQHRWGRTRAVRFLDSASFNGRHVAVGEGETLAGLSERQRVALSASLREQRQGGKPPRAAKVAPMTEREIRQIRELRAEGITQREVADVIGCSVLTVRRYAPGKPGKVSVAPIRERVLASGISCHEIAKTLGWWHNGGADGSRVRRALGIVAETNVSRGKRRRYFAKTADAEIVSNIAEAIGIMPWEVLPDD